MEAVLTDVARAAVEETLKRIIEKARRGKRLSDWEIGLLIISQLTHRIDAVEKNLDELKIYIDARFNQVDAKLADLKNYIDKTAGDLKSYVDRSIADLRDHVDKSNADSRNYVDKSLADLKNYVDKSNADLKDYVDKSIANLRSYVDKSIGDLRTYVDIRFDEVKNAINRIAADTDYLKKSLDQLRDNVINILLEELKRRL